MCKSTLNMTKCWIWKEISCDFWCIWILFFFPFCNSALPVFSPPHFVPICHRRCGETCLNSHSYDGNSIRDIPWEKKMGVLKHLTAWQWQYLKKQRKMSHQWVINSLNSQIPQDFLLKWKSTVPLNHIAVTPGGQRSPPKTLVRWWERCENPSGQVGKRVHRTMIFDGLPQWFPIGGPQLHSESGLSLARLKVRFYSGVNLNSYANQKVHVIVKAEIVASNGNWSIGIQPWILGIVFIDMYSMYSLHAKMLNAIYIYTYMEVSNGVELPHALSRSWWSWSWAVQVPGCHLPDEVGAQQILNNLQDRYPRVFQLESVQGSRGQLGNFLGISQVSLGSLGIPR